MFICLLLVLNFLASEIYTKSICASMKKGLVASFIVTSMARCIIGIKVGCPWRCMIIATQMEFDNGGLQVRRIPQNAG
jgi:hypothetical protein